jgi:hypothetical protein
MTWRDDRVAEYLELIRGPSAPSRWDAALDPVRTRDVIMRVVEILRERMSAVGDPLSRDDVMAELVRLGSLDRDAARVETVRRFSLRSWNVDASRDWVQMVFEGSIYEGTIGHRH